MDEVTFRILDVLGRSLGSAISINELTSRIRKLHGTAYYKNIYDKIQKLKKQEILNLAEIGKTSIASLNFDNYRLTDLLTEMELRRKNEFLDKKTELQMLFLEMETYLIQWSYHISSTSLINPEKNIRLNRAEFLFILRKLPPTITEGVLESEEKREKDVQEEIPSIHTILQTLQDIHNIKLDYLVLREKEFFELLKAKESNPLKEMLANKIAFFAPQAFWVRIKLALMKGIQVKIQEKETNPAKISKRNLIYNLSRFGYKEIGPKIEEGEKICLETIVTAILLQGDARKIDAIPILLAKNKPNYNLLIFLCQKYNRLGKLLGLLKILNKIRHNKETENAIGILEIMKIKEEKFDAKSIERKMRLYRAA